MALKTLSAKAAAELDKELMSTGGFSIDQLMELAGLSVSQAVYRLHPPSAGKTILIACGPGNNGGDGLVCARHLFHYSYKPVVYYPKRSSSDLYSRLCTQISDLGVPFVTDFPKALSQADHVVDAIFGFSFRPPIREPFPAVIAALVASKVPVTSVDAPSGWDVDAGPPAEGPAKDFHPAALVSLTAPKPLVKFFKGRHFLGGRFVAPKIAEKYGFEVPEYPGIDQVVEIKVEDQGDTEAGDKL